MRRRWLSTSRQASPCRSRRSTARPALHELVKVVVVVVPLIHNSGAGGRTFLPRMWIRVGIEGSSWSRTATGYHCFVQLNGSLSSSSLSSFVSVTVTVVTVAAVTVDVALEKAVKVLDVEEEVDEDEEDDGSERGGGAIDAAVRAGVKAKESMRRCKPKITAAASKRAFLMAFAFSDQISGDLDSTVPRIRSLRRGNALQAS
jgi:hypothetical protein